MPTRRLIEPALMSGIGLLLLGAIILTTLHIQRLRHLNSTFALENGLWVPTQQEREIGRVRELLWRISLDDPQAAAEYPLNRDLMRSRVMDVQSARNRASLTPSEAAVQDRVLAALESFQMLEGGQVPDMATAQRLLPVVDTMARDSRELTNLRRAQAMQTNSDLRSAMGTLQAILIGAVVGLVLLSSGLVYLRRRAVRANLAGLYAQAQQRTHELEAAQTQLATANTAVTDRNRELTTTLAVLEQTLAQRQALEHTVETMSLPIIPVVNGVLVMPLVGTITAAQIDQASTRLLATISAERSRTAILDITGVTAIDRAIAQALLTLADAVRLIGCTLVLVGVTPASAEALIQSGIDPTAVMTYSTLQQGVAWALAQQRAAPSTRRRG